MRLDFRAVEADSGSIGGSASTEFHVLAESGEDLIAFSSDGEYAANIELAEAITPSARRRAREADRKHRHAGPENHTIRRRPSQCIDIKKTVKTLVVKGHQTPIVVLVLRGDHTLNALKAEKLEAVARPLTFADESEIKAVIGCGPGSIGPVGLNCPVIVDRAASVVSNFVCGANQDGAHWINANWGRDVTESPVADLRNIESGDPAPTGAGFIEIKRGIEVGHIFQLGQ